MSDAVDLYWIPLGAGGNGFVRANGRVYERFAAWRERREPLALFHTALVIRVGGRETVVENAWPSPDDDLGARGVVVVGPVWFRAAGRFRSFRYEVRRWPGGVIPDLAEAVGGPTRVSDEAAFAAALCDLVPQVPAYTWGRAIPGAPEMWNSNSVISWLLTRVGADVLAIKPPPGGRAPGWAAGVAMATEP